MIGALENLGVKTLAFFEYAGRCASLFFSTLYYFLRGPREIGLTFFQMSNAGVNSLPIVLLTTAFTGMILALQVTRELSRFGANRLIGGVVAVVVVRELGPVLTAVVMAGRVGSSMASELGSMKVTEQIDALRSLATNPVQYLVAPRMAAMLTMIPVVAVIGCAGAVLAGYAVAWHMIRLPWIVYSNSIFNMVDNHDVFAGLAKTLVFAATVAVVGCHEGMATRGGAAGVGRATTNAVVVSIVLIFAFNYFLSAALF